MNESESIGERWRRRDDNELQWSRRRREEEEEEEEEGKKGKKEACHKKRPLERMEEIFSCPHTHERSVEEFSGKKMEIEKNAR